MRRVIWWLRRDLGVVEMLSGEQLPGVC